MINNAYDKAVRLLNENRQYLDVMARVLIERETIYTEEVDMIMDGKSVQEILTYMEKKDNINPLEKATKKAEAEGEVGSTEPSAASTDVESEAPANISESPADTDATDTAPTDSDDNKKDD
jgi:hypothetical protein